MSFSIALKIGSLNIHGHANIKCGHDDVLKEIMDHHIYAVQETWLGPQDACPAVPGYSLFRSERKRHHRAKRNSGGTIVFVKHSVQCGVQKVISRSSKNGDIIWMKLCKKYFSLENDVYICSAYIVPGSDDDVFEAIRKDVELFSTTGYIGFIGDLNCRIGERQANHFEVRRVNDEND